MLTKTLKTVFFLCFLLMTAQGMYLSRNESEYIPVTNSSPVISTTVSTDSTECSVYNMGGKVFPENSAQSASVICADTGEFLYLKNADTPLPMASTTKIMTAITAIENIPQNSICKVPAEVCGTEGSSIYLTPGEEISVTDLLYGLLLESGNDAASALAWMYPEGSTEFIGLMNRKAKEMGLLQTNFENPHGLSAENHRTTARELALISYHAMKNPLFRQIVGTKTYTVKNKDGIPVKYFSNHNKLLRSYEGMTGIKTGYTLSSGRCLVTSAKRNGSEFIVVTLNDRNDFRDHTALLDYAFATYRTVSFAKKGELSFLLGEKRFSNPEDVCVTACEDITKKDFSLILTAD